MYRVKTFKEFQDEGKINSSGTVPGWNSEGDMNWMFGKQFRPEDEEFIHSRIYNGQNIKVSEFQETYLRVAERGWILQYWNIIEEIELEF